MRIITYTIIMIPLLLALFGTLGSFIDSSYSAFANQRIPFMANVSDTYVNPNVGFRITFPPGWSGIEVGPIVLVAPTGINPRLGVLNPSSDLEMVYIILTRSNTSDILRNPQDRNLSGYHEYVNDSARGIGCKVLSDEFVKLNGLSSEKVVGKCGPLQELSMLTYAVASGKNVIFIGLKGITSAFEHNLEFFMQSLETMEFDHESDIKKLISKSYRPD